MADYNSYRQDNSDKNKDSEDMDYTMAAALGYDIEKDNAPKILARGRGEIAQKIIEKAREEEIPIHSDQDIVKILVKMELGEETPPQLYRAIAEILSFIYNLDSDPD